MVAIDLKKFVEYITKINDLVKTIGQCNKEYSSQIIQLENLGWRDDKYKEARNQLVSLQQSTNQFIVKLEKIDKELVTWFCVLMDAYYDVSSDYPRPQVDIQLVDVIDSQIETMDGWICFNKDALLIYVNSTRSYINGIRSALDGILTVHKNFEEFFKSSRYQDIDKAITHPIATLSELLGQMDSFVNSIVHIIDVIVKYQKG